jgi:hypothetical protein
MSEQHSQPFKRDLSAEIEDLKVYAREQWERAQQYRSKAENFEFHYQRELRKRQQLERDLAELNKKLMEFAVRIS